MLNRLKLRNIIFQVQRTLIKTAYFHPYTKTSFNKMIENNANGAFDKEELNKSNKNKGLVENQEVLETKENIANNVKRSNEDIDNVESDKPNEDKNSSKDNSNSKAKKNKPLLDKRARFGDWKNNEGERKSSGEPRKPKRRVALFFGYCGVGYSGMQINPGIKTIEQDLFEALCKIGAVSKDNSDDIRKISFMRAARTDKGVSAAGQVVSLKYMIVDIENLIEKLNDALPEQIRAFGFVRTLSSFNAKNMCDSRVYEYLMPTYVLMPPRAYEKPAEYTHTDPLPLTTEEERDSFRKYRISKDTMETLQKALDLYKGTNNYHNFTIKRTFNEQASNRFIHSFKVGTPFIKNDLEWISLKVHGQSFMMHQIRKMVAMVVMIVRSNSPIDIIRKSFEDIKINIPKAPGVGLLLEKPVYNNLNNSKKIKDDPDKAEITFDPYIVEMEEFKNQHIYPTIFEEEKQNHIFDEFIKLIDFHKSSYTYINKEGILYPRPETIDQIKSDDEEETAGDD